jgi:hypothetical protein
MCVNVRLGSSLTAVLARKIARIAQKEMMDIVAAEPDAVKVMRLNMSPSRAPARRPLSTAHVSSTRESGSASMCRRGGDAVAGPADAAAGAAPPVAAKNAPSSTFVPSISRNVRSCPIQRSSRNWQASRPRHAPSVFQA